MLQFHKKKRETRAEVIFFEGLLLHTVEERREKEPTGGKELLELLQKTEGIIVVEGLLIYTVETWREGEPTPRKELPELL